MKHDKLVFIRIICLVGIIGEVLFPNSTVGILFGLILAITSVIFLMMLKNEIAPEPVHRSFGECQDRRGYGREGR